MKSIFCFLIAAIGFFPWTSRGQVAVGDLPHLEDYESHRSSSYDTSGGNRNAAWGFSRLYATPLVGLVEFTGEQPGGRYIMYRWHLEAPIRFHKSIKVSIEDGHASMRSDNIYTVAYWYQKEPHAAFPALPAVDQRIPRTIWTGGAGQDPNMK